MADTKKFDPNSYSVAYWRMRNQWTDSLNLYEPLPETLSRYLHRYSSEDNKDFAERVKRLAQVNFTEYVVQFWNSMLFSSKPEIKCADSCKDDVDAFVNDCNGFGDTLMEYARDVIAPTSFLYGICDVVVDLPSTSQDLITLADEQSLGLKNPYCYVIPPLNRIQWGLNNNKHYNMYTSYDIINTQISASMGIKDEKQYQRWTDETVEQFDAMGNVTSQKANPYGFIPIVPVLYRNSQRFFSDKIGISLVKDVVPIQKLIINLISLIFDYHEQSNFAHRILIQDTTDGNIDNAPTQQEAQAMSNHRMSMLYGSGSDLKIMVPDPAGVESMHGLLRLLVELLFLACGMPSDYGQNKTHQSEGTVRANGAKVFNSLGVMARQYEKAFKKIIETMLLVKGYTPEEVRAAQITVRWDTNFSYAPFSQTIEELAALKAAIGDISPTALKEMVKRTLSPKLSDAIEWDKIEGEIDAADVSTPEPVPPTVKPPMPSGTDSGQAPADSVEGSEVA